MSRLRGSGEASRSLGHAAKQQESFFRVSTSGLRGWDWQAKDLGSFLYLCPYLHLCLCLKFPSANSPEHSSCGGGKKGGDFGAAKGRRGLTASASIFRQANPRLHNTHAVQTPKSKGQKQARAEARSMSVCFLNLQIPKSIRAHTFMYRHACIRTHLHTYVCVYVGVCKKFGAFRGVPLMRVKMCWNLFWGPPFWETSINTFVYIYIHICIHIHKSMYS